MRLTVSVTQRHIDDSNECVASSENWPLVCPIALALHEQVGKGRYRLKRFRFNYKIKVLEFTTGQEFSVAEDIRWKNLRIRHTKETAEFVAAFDRGENVEPFTFEFNDFALQEK